MIRAVFVLSLFFSAVSAFVVPANQAAGESYDFQSPKFKLEYGSSFPGRITAVNPPIGQWILESIHLGKELREMQYSWFWFVKKIGCMTPFMYTHSVVLLIYCSWSRLRCPGSP